MNRRRLFLVGGTGIAAALTGVNLVSAQTSSPEAVETDDSVAILERAATAMSELETFGFSITNVAGETTILDLLTVEEISGVVRRPMDFMATINVSTPIGGLEVTAVGIDGSAWLQNPLSDGEWISLAEAGDGLLSIVNPDSLILASIGLIQNPRLDGSDQIDGQDVTRIAGTLDFAAIAESSAGSTTELPAELATEPLDVLIWIDSNDHVLEIELDGPILAAESDDVIRAISFFDFDEPVEIEEPAL